MECSIDDCLLVSGASSVYLAQTNGNPTLASGVIVDKVSSEMCVRARDEVNM